MLLETFVLLLSVAVSFLLVAAIRQDRRFLVMAGGVFLMLGGMTWSSGTLQVHDGWTVSENRTHDTETTNVELVNITREEEKTYRNVADDYDFGGYSFTQTFSILLLISGLTILLIGVFVPGSTSKIGVLRG